MFPIVFWSSHVSYPHKSGEVVRAGFLPLRRCLSYSLPPLPDYHRTFAPLSQIPPPPPPPTNTKRDPEILTRITGHAFALLQCHVAIIYLVTQYDTIQYNTIPAHHINNQSSIGNQQSAVISTHIHIHSCTHILPIHPPTHPFDHSGSSNCHG